MKSLEERVQELEVRQLKLDKRDGETLAFLREFEERQKKRDEQFIQEVRRVYAAVAMNGEHE